MQSFVQLKIKTLSNLFIGGAPAPFEIGGIDLQTVTDPMGFPMIPGSSLKGALRAIVCEDTGKEAKIIAQLYSAYLNHDKASNQTRIQELVHEEEARKRILRRYEEALNNLSASYLFGIKGFNNTPKLLFSDLLVSGKSIDLKSCFSIDMKNSINSSGEKPHSTPRTYKTARGGLVFEGTIQLHKMELLGNDACTLCENYLIQNLKKFNSGIFRLGNSKSRGYGKVEVLITKEIGEPGV